MCSYEVGIGGSAECAEVGDLSSQCSPSSGLIAVTWPLKRKPQRLFLSSRTATPQAFCTTCTVLPMRAAMWGLNDRMYCTWSPYAVPRWKPQQSHPRRVWSSAGGILLYYGVYNRRHLITVLNSLCARTALGNLIEKTIEDIRV